MSAFEIIAGEQLILPEWRVIATCVGIDFETGGTMMVAVYVDPQLNPALPLSTPTKEEVKKHVLDPERVDLVMQRLKPRMKMSAETQQILMLTFSSRDRAPYFDWVLDHDMDRLTRGGKASVELLGHPDGHVTILLGLLILNLGRLQAWSNVNRQRFSAYRLMVKPGVAQALSLTCEHVGDDDGGHVIIFEESLAPPL